jgi:hypothetical protein
MTGFEGNFFSTQAKLFYMCVCCSERKYRRYRLKEINQILRKLMLDPVVTTFTLDDDVKAMWTLESVVRFSAEGYLPIILVHQIYVVCTTLIVPN